MEQSGADENYIGGILACLGAQNTIQICRKMDLDENPKQFDWTALLSRGCGMLSSE